MVVRLELQMEEHDVETWLLASHLREAHRLGVAPRNTDACSRYGQTCAYFPICAGEAEAEDPSKYRELEWVHPELKKETA
jgi:hypothetical protein